MRAIADLGASFRRADLVVLCYHRIRDRRRFTDQMRALVEAHYAVVSLDEVTAWLAGRPLWSRAALLTFDGCHSDQMDHAVPVLESLKLPATFFPTSAGLHPSVGAAGAARSRELRELVKAGHTIGCHTHTHPDLTTLPTHELYREIVGSRSILEDAVGRRVGAFCYPYGGYDGRVVSMVRDAGFDLAFTVELGGVCVEDDRYRLKRVPVLGEPGRLEFLAYLSGAFGVSGTTLLVWKIRERFLDRRQRHEG